MPLEIFLCRPELFFFRGEDFSGMGKLRVRRAAKVCFAVACKVIACNIKRWAKAHTASGEALNRFIWIVLRRIGLIEANIYKHALV
jgi:hypothetical protein